MAWGAVFQVNCTVPQGNPIYVSEPNVRSTLSILWSTVSTIILCTWTVQHLSLPADQKIPGEDLGARAKRIWQMLWRKVKWMLVAIIMPEFLVGKALGDYIAAHRSARCRAMQSHARKSGTSWTITHAFFANMGGYRLHQGDVDNKVSANTLVNWSYLSLSEPDTLSPPEPISELSPEPPFQPPRRIRTRCCFKASQFDLLSNTNSKPSTMSRIFDLFRSDQHWWDEEVPDPSLYTDEDRDFEPPFAVNSAQICVLMSKGLISQLPTISEEEIKDKSKEDILVKLLALGQIVWLMVELIARKVNGLSSTLLEIAALSFSICAIFTYSLLLGKPKDITEPTKIFLTGRLDDDDKNQLLWLNTASFFRNALSLEGTMTPGQTIENDVSNAEARLGSLTLGPFWHFTTEDFGFGLGAVIFGSVHCLAWNFAFPTRAEQILWRNTSVLITVVFPVYYFSMILLSLFAKVNSPWRVVQQVATSTTFLLYTICRLFIIVEVIRSLAYLPPDAFLATWSGSIPHIS
ncbi:hypothetical protein F4818DRAFT_10348 [Hypoxylon cercidicola]|nr:hypothetical protein F4818DRAFT_10348 [Hypoxylon cercidicola]